MTNKTTILVPDIGDFKEVPVIEILVKPGDEIKVEDALVTLESDKATIDVPAPIAGIIREIIIKMGDTVSAGTPMMVIEIPQDSDSQSGSPDIPEVKPGKQAEAVPLEASSSKSETMTSSFVQADERPRSPVAPENVPSSAEVRSAHAGPSLRKFARELGIDIAKVPATGPRGRIQREDILAYVKGVTTQTSSAPAPTTATPETGTLNLLPWPKVDFARFGPVNLKPLSRIKKIAGANLSRNWAMIPHVTNQDEADITELESFRQRLNLEGKKSDVKISMLAFLIKACASVLKKFPNFNASLDGDNLVIKDYFNIGFAADTPNGLMVPVIRDVDKKGIFDIAREMSELARLAREGALKPDQMQGGCFSISSLGGIGGTFFTPIINAPEVAILGVCKSQMKPVWDGSTFTPRLILPLSLSWDHRVINGAEAARFNVHLAQLLSDMRRVLV
ncbi:MAG: dihydrolipoyllysine-residue acetyltransferase [Rhodocyclaceae bacterium]|nr:dihydrolipoyllysine-residue acetyltransferase [Rhodocyclaceae bacterium]